MNADRAAMTRSTTQGDVRIEGVRRWSTEIWNSRGLGDVYGFCFGEDAERAAEVVESSFRGAEEAEDAAATHASASRDGHDNDAPHMDAGDVVCGRYQLMRAYVCGADELDFYLTYFFHGDVTALPPSVFCPSQAGGQSGVTGCSPGFFTLRTGGTSWAPAACCPGYFCPSNLACMIRCPVGSFCPRAAAPAPLFGGYSLGTRYEEQGGGTAERRFCAPYGYEALRLGHVEACGGADNWHPQPRELRWRMSDLLAVPATRRDDFSWTVQTSLGQGGDARCGEQLTSMGSIHCPPGWYCPTPATAIPCPSGHRCDTGARQPIRCGPFDSCARCSTSVSTLSVTTILIATAVILTLLVCVGSWRRLATRVRRIRERIHMRLVAQRPWVRDGRGSGGGGATGIAGSSDSALEMANLLGVTSAEMADGESSVASETSAASSEPPSHRISISFAKLSVTVRRKQVLKDVNGRFTPGQMTAIMGGSGCGKSTLLAALLGRGIASYAKVTGAIRVVASRRRRTGSVKVPASATSLRRFRKLIGYVPQDDIVYVDLTVAENIMVSARYRVSGVSRDALLTRTNSLVRLLGLNDVRDNVVGEVSGGQRRRVSIAIELVATPCVLFADEPTSGLDACSSRAVIRTLSELASAGLTVAAVIHTPSSSCFLAFDSLILLQQKGSVSYAGARADAVEYFENVLGFTVLSHNVNVADVLLDISEGYLEPYSDVGPDLEEQWKRYRDEVGPREDGEGGCDGDGDNGYGSGPREVDSDVEEESTSYASAAEYLERDGEECTDIDVRVRRRHAPDFVTHLHLCLSREALQASRRPLSVLISIIVVALSGTALGIVGGSLQPIDTGVTEYSLIMLSLLAVVFGEQVRSKTLPNDRAQFAAIVVVVVVVVLMKRRRADALLMVAVAIKVFTRDRQVFLRETASGLSCVAYFLAKVVADILASCSFSFLYFWLFFSIAHPHGSFLLQYVLYGVTFFCVSGFGMLVGLGMSRGRMASSGAIAAIVLTLTWILTTVHLMFKHGYLQKKPAAIHAYLAASPSFHFFRGSLALQARDVLGVWIPVRCGVLHRFGFTIASFPSSLLALFVLGSLFRALAFLFLLFRSTPFCRAPQ